MISVVGFFPFRVIPVTDSVVDLASEIEVNRFLSYANAFCVAPFIERNAPILMSDQRFKYRRWKTSNKEAKV